MKKVSVLEDYSVVLNLTDVAYGVYGHNKFYKLQLLQCQDKPKWILWTCWGRVGADNPSQSVQEYYNKFDAMAEFERTFYKKTKNKWTERMHFKQHPNKYMMIKAD